MNSVLNVSAYRFVDIADPAALRERLYADASTSGLRGTILLAHEGINLFLAGDDARLRAFLARLCEDARFAGLEVKESSSPAMPFRRLLVKVKREIIRMNHPAVQPQAGRAPAIDATTVQRWIERGQDDEGRELVLLDTRNAFEVEHGTFEGAVHWQLAKFSDFPAAFDAHRAALDGKTVVSFCTGGIRCEKAALYMREAGLRDVYQLDGGILRYFEETGGAGYRGDCFVFDEREALDAGLSPVRSAARAA